MQHERATLSPAILSAIWTSFSLACWRPRGDARRWKKRRQLRLDGLQQLLDLQRGLCTAPAVATREAKQQRVKARGWGRTWPQLEEPPQGSPEQLGLGVTWKTEPVPNTECLPEVTARKVLGSHHSKTVKNWSLHAPEIDRKHTQTHPNLFSSIHPSSAVLRSHPKSSGGQFKGCPGHRSLPSRLPAAGICLCPHLHRGICTENIFTISSQPTPHLAAWLRGAVSRSNTEP